ncbi:MAG: hypothetical protein PUE04_01830 [Lachnospira sp.]|nr:hypothetical protein [Lachnospira sp.]
MKKTMDIYDAAELLGVTPQTMRIMIRMQKMPENVAVYVRQPMAKSGRYIIWEDAFRKFYGPEDRYA